ncbi:hypothetical protein [Paenibacillus sp. YIM B09110]|uniref:hypothetical protein n=1 Tax=Paenibacillus sp. YIM B09110 TaxID=3126102 RepID=UPI00301D55E7
MRKALKRLAILIGILILLLACGGWWLVSYVEPDEALTMSYEPISVKDKALDMIKKLKPELVLTEADINNLVKMHMSASAEPLAPDTTLDGAAFDLEGDRLVAKLNVTYKDRVPVQLQAEYKLEWQSPNIVLRPRALTVKDIHLPLRMLETQVIPLDLPQQDVVTLQDVQFTDDHISILFKLQLKLNL